MGTDPVVAEAKLRTDINQQVAEQMERGPTWPLHLVRSTSANFHAEVENCMERMVAWAQDPPPLAGEPPEALQARRERYERSVQTTRVLVKVRREAVEEISVVMATPVSSGRGKLYSGESRDHSGRVMTLVTGVRTMLTDLLPPTTAMAKEIRELCGVGEAVNPQSPLAVMDVARRQVRTLRPPLPGEPPLSAGDLATLHARLEFLEGHGVVVDSYVADLDREIPLLEAALAKAPETDTSIRTARDRAHIKTEIISLRILGQVQAVLGLEARDALRDCLPKSTSGQRRSDRDKKDSSAGGGETESNIGSAS